MYPVLYGQSDVYSELLKQVIVTSCIPENNEYRQD